MIAVDRQAPRERTLSSQPKVLVLLAARNGEQWIGDQLQSILDQRQVSVHVMVRDDCSTDRTLNVIEDFECSQRVEVTKSTRPSGSASGNFFSLISENPCEGFDFVALADQDDVWNLDKLSRACQILVAAGTAGYSSSVTAMWEDGTQRLLRQNRNQTKFDFLFEGAGQGCTFVVTAEFYRKARDFMRENLSLVRRMQFHDWTIYALARCWALGWTFDDLPTMMYRQHGSNVIGARTSIEGIQRRFFLIKSGWYRTQLSAVAAICSAAAPRNFQIQNWSKLLEEPDSCSRRLRLMMFCASQSRRSTVDKVVLLLSAAASLI